MGEEHNQSDTPPNQDPLPGSPDDPRPYRTITDEFSRRDPNQDDHGTNRGVDDRYRRGNLLKRMRDMIRSQLSPPRRED